MKAKSGKYPVEECEVRCPFCDEDITIHVRGEWFTEEPVGGYGDSFELVSASPCLGCGQTAGQANISEDEMRDAYFYRYADQ